MRISNILLGALALAAASPAFAQDATEPADELTITGSATVVSDYRFRGFSQTNEKATIQGGFTLAHETGLYIGTWGSGVGFANGSEIDVFGGVTKEIAPGVTGDIGATVYLYPGAAGSTVVEPYLAVSGTLGPASLKGGVAWAPSGQTSLGDKSGVYLYSDLVIGVPGEPIKLKGHAGFSKSDSFLGGADGDVFDYSIGAEVSLKSISLGLAYVNTDAPTTFGYKDAIGADGAVVFSVGAAF